MKHTNEYYRRRTENLKYANQIIKGCLKKVYIHNYIPGQVIYNLGEYPNKMSIMPTEYDYRLIKKLSENGVGLIQIHEEWNDSLRIMGADKYTSHDKNGLKEFIKLCHSFDIKVLPYVSSGFFDVRDPDYTDRFIRSDAKLYMNYYRYRMCSAASPEWNKYLFDNIRRMLDEYEFDGIFNDMGYDMCDDEGNKYKPGEYDPFIEDMLIRLYDLVKNEYGGIVKLHQGEIMVPVSENKIYDYLWVGENCETSEELIKTVNCSPYVIPCPDYKTSKEKNYDIYFSRALPFLQFLLRADGRPITGERVCAPGIEYLEDIESGHFRKIREYYLKHQNGPWVYSEWSDIPDDELMRKKWFEYLRLYKPMVTENSCCFIDINKDNGLTAEPVDNDVHMSMFVNEDCYVCISNVGTESRKVVFKQIWTDRVTKKAGSMINIPPGGMIFLKKQRGDTK